MEILITATAVLSAAVHVLIFYWESVAWTRPAVWKRFGLARQEDAETTRTLAYNQGFYNLFLAIGVAAGVAQIAAGAEIAGRSIVLFACLCMVWAGIVLLVTSPRLAQAALVQLAPPLVAIVATFVLR